MCAYCGDPDVEVRCPHCDKWFCGRHRGWGSAERCWKLVIQTVREARARVRGGLYYHGTR